MTLGENECQATINAPANDISSLQQAFMSNPTCIRAFALLSMTLYSPLWADIASRLLIMNILQRPYLSRAVSPQIRTYVVLAALREQSRWDGVDALTLCGSDLLSCLKTTYLILRTRFNVRTLN
jgi:hypothetical protein